MNWQDCIADALDLIASATKLPLFIGGSFFSILGSIPDMIRFYFKLRKLFEDTEHLYETLQKIPVMSAAIRKAQDTGDTSDLEALFGKPKTTLS